MSLLLSATQVAYLMLALQYGLLAFAWLAGAALVPEFARSLRHWAAHALLTGAGVSLLVFGNAVGDDTLRATANLFVVVAFLALHRGVRLFFDARPRLAPHVGLFLVALVSSAFGMLPEYAAQRIAVTSLVLAVVTAWTAADMYRLGQPQFGLGWRRLLVAPALVCTLVFALRGALALMSPRLGVQVVTSDNPVNATIALVYFVMALAFQLSLIGLVVSRLVSELQRTSRHDPLTGLLNRRAIEEALRAEVRRVRRFRETFAVLMIDADHFKQLNDREGHSAGDRALQHLATLLRAQMRDVDRVARWGGEEFLVLMPGAGEDDAVALAQRLRDRVASVPPRWHDRPLAMTVSIGVAEWAGDRDTLPGLIERADVALYEAKSLGRDQVAAASHTAPVPLGPDGWAATQPPLH